jgi:hypothetical protein
LKIAGPHAIVQGFFPVPLRRGHEVADELPQRVPQHELGGLALDGLQSVATDGIEIGVAREEVPVVFRRAHAKHELVHLGIGEIVGHPITGEVGKTDERQPGLRRLLVVDHAAFALVRVRPEVHSAEAHDLLEEPPSLICQRFPLALFHLQEPPRRHGGEA